MTREQTKVSKYFFCFRTWLEFALSDVAYVWVPKSMTYEIEKSLRVFQKGTLSAHIIHELLSCVCLVHFYIRDCDER